MIQLIDLDFEVAKMEAFFDESMKDNDQVDSFELECKIVNLDHIFDFFQFSNDVFDELEEILFDLDNKEISSKEAILQIKEIVKSRMCLIDSVESQKLEGDNEDGDFLCL